MKYALKDSIAYRFIRAANSVSRALNKTLCVFEITTEQRATLEIIKFEPNVNQTKIADLLGKDKTTISRSLNSLEKKGLIKKLEIINDKRSNKVTLTQKGENILENTVEQLTNYRESLNSKLTKAEQIEFFRLIDKLEL